MSEIDDGDEYQIQKDEMPNEEHFLESLYGLLTIIFSDTCRAKCS